MSFRYNIKDALHSLILPAVIYAVVALSLLYAVYPQFYLIKHEVIISLSIFAMWRYGWMFLNYSRALIYNLFFYPSLKKKIQQLPPHQKYPKNLYFMIPSYKEEGWVTVETFRSIFSELESIPSAVTIVVATSGYKEDETIKKMFEAHSLDKKITLIFQHQEQGKRIAMGHALRSIARHFYKLKESDPSSVTIFMDGDSYMEDGFLKKILPFFAIESNLGALTTNEAAYIHTKSKWYKDWFNLKFGQRHIIFQAHSLSKKVLTLTGRLSAYRTSIVIEEEFISLVENDILIDPIHGKFRFLMGDDKSTWFYLLKHGWDMLYIPDALCISLESRDGNFLELSRTLPYRWFGNTLRNNSRSLKLGVSKMGWYIWYAILDQRLIQWTSLVGVSSAIILAITISPYYIVFFIIWVIFVRLFQIFVIALGGHRVSWRFPILIAYSQWIGAWIKIKAFYNLSDQKWSKNADEQRMDNNKDHINSPLVRLMPKVMMATSVSAFLLLLLFAHHVISFDNTYITAFLDNFWTSNQLIASTEVKNCSNVINLKNRGLKEGGKNNAKIINDIISNYHGKERLILVLPSGKLDFYHPIKIVKNNITIRGASTDKTMLISHLHTQDRALIQIVGERKKRLGYVSSTIYKYQAFFKMETDRPLSHYLLIREPNDKRFLQKLGSKVWNRQYPYLRQEIVELFDYGTDTKTIYIKKPLLTDFSAGKSEVIALEPRRDITLENFSIKQISSLGDIRCVDGNYSNCDKNVAVDMIYCNYAAKCNISNIHILQSGSHAIVLENSYGMLIDKIFVNGSWNKGKKGNGYVRVARTYHSVIRDSTIENIRHLTLQWSSSGNHLYNLNMGVDINLHGGFAHQNIIEHINFDIPKSHHWNPIEHCPNNARWAPPDGENIIKYDTFKFTTRSKK